MTERDQRGSSPGRTESPPEGGSGGTSGGGKVGRTRTVVLDDVQPQAEPPEGGSGNPGGGGKVPGDRKREVDLGNP